MEFSDNELVALGHAYVNLFTKAANEPDATSEQDEKMRQYMKTDEHRMGIVVGFVRGYRACEQLRQTPTLQPGSN